MLQKLMELNISYNWLGDNCGTLLAVILQKCPLLNTLKLESCGLTSQISALGKEFPVALKGKCQILSYLTNQVLLRRDFNNSLFSPSNF